MFDVEVPAEKTSLEKDIRNYIFATNQQLERPVCSANIDRKLLQL